MSSPLLCSLCLLASAPTSGPPERLAVLPVLLEADAHARAKDVFFAVDEAAALRPGLRVMSIDDYYFHEGQALAKRTLGCGADAACMAQQLAPFDARLGLVVLVNGELDPPLVSVLLLDGAKGAVAAQWAGQVEGSVTARIRDEVAAQLEARGFIRHGRLRVRAEPPSTTLQVGDTGPDLGTADRFTLPPGPHTLRAAADGFRPQSRAVEVTAGATREVEITLEPEPSVWRSPWLWLGVGVAVAGAATTAAVLGSRGGDSCLCVVTAGMTDCGGCR